VVSFDNFKFHQFNFFVRPPRIAHIPKELTPSFKNHESRIILVGDNSVRRRDWNIYQFFAKYIFQNEKKSKLSEYSLYRHPKSFCSLTFTCPSHSKANLQRQKVPLLSCSNDHKGDIQSCNGGSEILRATTAGDFACPAATAFWACISMAASAYTACVPWAAHQHLHWYTGSWRGGSAQRRG
jgi:hypothetical protein